MGNWGVSPNASDKEKIKSEWADELNGQNSTGNIAYDTYSELFDVGMDLLDKMYELGKSDGAKEHRTRQNDDKVGEWTEKDGIWFECSICGCYSYDKLPNCPDCGIKMEAKG